MELLSCCVTGKRVRLETKKTRERNGIRWGGLLLSFRTLFGSRQKALEQIDITFRKERRGTKSNPPFNPRKTGRRNGKNNS